MKRMEEQRAGGNQSAGQGRWATIFLFMEGRKGQYLFSALFFASLFLYGWWRATRGIDLTDEGMYLSTAMRYSLGDLPFRDEIMNLLRPFDILVSLVFRLNPHVTLLDMRLIGMALHLAVLLVFFVLLCRHFPPLPVSLLLGITFFLNNYFGIMSPSYNLLSNEFSLLAAALWLFGARGGGLRLFFASAAGLCGALAVLSYLPLMAPYAVVVAFMLLAAVKDRALRPAALVCVSSFCAVLLVFLAWLLLSGLQADYHYWYRAVVETNLAYNRGISGKFMDLLREFRQTSARGLLTLSVLALGILCVPRQRRVLTVSVAAILLALQGALYYFIFLAGLQDTRFIPLNAVAFSIVLVSALLVLDLCCHPSVETAGFSWRRERMTLFAWGLLPAVTYGISSNNGVRNLTRGLTCLLVPSVLYLGQLLEGYTGGRGESPLRKQVWPAMMLLVVLFLLGESMVFNYRCVYRDLPLQVLDTPFAHPRLKGIYSTAAKVRATDGLLLYLEKRVPPGASLLAYNYIPMVYFLTGSRPLYPAAWARDDWPLPFREKLFQRMMEKEERAMYCVRMTAEPEDDWKRAMLYEPDSLLDRYVQREYSLEKVIYPFEIWRRREGPCSPRR